MTAFRSGMRAHRPLLGISQRVRQALSLARGLRPSTRDRRASDPSGSAPRVAGGQRERRRTAGGPELRKRLAAILAADAAGYARLMCADETATVAMLDAARAVFRKHIESNRGRVIDMAGDSVLAVFDTSAGAVAAALTIQRELEAISRAVPDTRRMRFRIGVHLGDVMEKVDGTVYGHGVNISARLEGLAEPGGITVSDAVRSAVHGSVGARFSDMGEQAVKNIAEPLRVHRVVPLSPG